MKAVLILLCAISVGAHAQVRFPVGERGSAASVPEDARQAGVARQVMEQFAICTYRSQRRTVEKILLEPVRGNPANRMAGIAKEDCLQTGELRFDPTMFRGGLFAAMYRSHFPKLAPTVVTAPIVDYGHGSDQLYVAAMQFSDCVVRADPIHADSLVRSSPASTSENDALRTIMPTLSNCVGRGNNSKFHKSTLRGFIAESLFKLSSAAQSGAAH